MGNMKSKVKQEEDKKSNNSMINELKEVNINDGSISSNAVDKVVDAIMNSKDVNISYFPDTVERQIYKNLIIYFFGVVKEVIKSSKIEFLNHEITFNIHPKN
jgi:hypothetical protein